MPARLRPVLLRLFPHGALDVIRQIALFMAAYYLYRLVRGAVDGRAHEAFANGRDIIDLERSLGTFIEPSVQAWSTGSGWLIDFASWMYINAQFSVTLAALVFIYLFHNSAFYFVRNMFMVAMALALVGYVAYPTAPPRFFPEWGFTDSVANFTNIPADSVPINALFNPFAAVPSMHVAFALMIGWPLARLVRFRPAKLFWFGYPFVVTWVVIATGNHFWLDAFLGALVAAVSAYAADRLFARARPNVWAFSPARAQATF